jgi:hypothetical protein
MFYMIWPMWTSYSRFWHCVVCSSAIYGFWLPLWYLQTLLNEIKYPTQKTKDRETKPNYLCALMNIIIYILPSVCNFIKRSLEARIWGSHWSNHIKHNIVFYQFDFVSRSLVFCVGYCISLRRVWRYQRGNQNPYIAEEQTTQCPQYTKGR